MIPLIEDPDFNDPAKWLCGVTGPGSCTVSGGQLIMTGGDGTSIFGANPLSGAINYLAGQTYNYRIVIDEFVPYPGSFCVFNVAPGFPGIGGATPLVPGLYEGDFIAAATGSVVPQAVAAFFGGTWKTGYFAISEVVDENGNEYPACKLERKNHARYRDPRCKKR